MVGSRVTYVFWLPVGGPYLEIFLLTVMYLHYPFTTFLIPGPEFLEPKLSIKEPTDSIQGHPLVFTDTIRFYAIRLLLKESLLGNMESLLVKYSLGITS